MFLRPTTLYFEMLTIGSGFLKVGSPKPLQVDKNLGWSFHLTWSKQVEVSLKENELPEPHHLLGLFLALSGTICQAIVPPNSQLSAHHLQSFCSSLAILFSGRGLSQLPVFIWVEFWQKSWKKNISNMYFCCLLGFYRANVHNVCFTTWVFVLSIEIETLIPGIQTQHATLCAHHEPPGHQLSQSGASWGKAHPVKRAKTTSWIANCTFWGRIS